MTDANAEQAANEVRTEVLSVAEDEIIRQRVRDELASQKRPKLSLWKLLNSSFALWFLSSIALSGLVFAYSEYNKARSEQRQSAARISALKDEIAFRLDTNLAAKIFDASGKGSEPPNTFH